jgi:hypothetical protein
VRQYPASFSHTRLLLFVQKKAKKKGGESRESRNDTKKGKSVWRRLQRRDWKVEVLWWTGGLFSAYIGCPRTTLRAILLSDSIADIKVDRQSEPWKIFQGE